ncbi:glycosyltransferase family 39 protein [Armatimonas sp.]|uniref:ArnT family glycosyltransferase n=1 Tax=Armatimonas sp. TaxID=1872638 RepID=UPI00286A1939|nr:glycosyltransferase family 39 protein [Armatimonas sp.]
MKSLYAILAAAFLLSVSFAVKVPLGNNPDETTHRDYIRLIVEQKGLVMFVPSKGRRPLPAPVVEKMQAREGMTELPEGALSRDETHQPPLYYVLTALVFAITGGGSLLALRLVALPFQLATVWIAWKAGRDLFAKRPELAPALAAFVAFLPIQAQLGGAISNDATTHFFCALIVWRMARFFAPHIAPPHRAYAWGEGALLGLFFGLGLLTKLTVLQLYPVLFVACALAIKAKRITFADTIGVFGAAVLVGLAIASPWLVRNQMLYGDFLAQTIYKATGPNFSPDEISQMSGWSGADYARNVGLRSFVSFWCFLDPHLPTMPLARFIGSPVLLLLTLVPALAPLLGLYKASKEKAVEPVFGFAALAVLCLVPFFTKFVYEVFQAQGRYFLPSLLAVALVCVGGFAALGKSKWAAFAPAALLLLLSLWQLVGGGYAASR